jgi:Ala-tRNA(Pro) deacylase
MRFLQTPEDKTVSMSPRIAAHLNKIGVNFDLVSHAHSRNSMQSARMSKLPPSQIAKAVILHDGDRYRMCVIPANHRLILERVNAHMHGNYRLATEREVAMLFDDCEIGAVPALGQVYGMPVSWEVEFNHAKDVYLESGDHEHLIHLQHGAFMELMNGQDHLHMSCPQDDRFGSIVH